MAAKKADIERLFDQQDALVTVTMDADVFRWLYDMLILKHQAQRYAGWLPRYQDEIARGYDAFRTAAGDEPIDISPEGSAPVKPVGKAKPEAVPAALTNGSEPHKRVIHRRVAKKK